MKRKIALILLFIYMISLVGCSHDAKTSPTQSETAGNSGTNMAGDSIPAISTDDEQTLGQPELHNPVLNTEATYAYINPDAGTLSARFNPPEGYVRVETDGFGEFLRAYPLLADGTDVLLYNGRKKGNQKDHAAVFDMDLVSGDLQQCADSCIRLYAEYFYQNGEYDRIAFHLTNGFLVDFDTWRQGYRVAVNGNKTEWEKITDPSDSEETFEKYLKFVFNYAGTLSVSQESEEADITNIQPGDFFIRGGSPGHVVMVLDVCENESGEKAFLLGQGYMPAQQFHVLKNPAYNDNPWYYVSEVSYPFVTPEYVFDEGSFRRPVYNSP